MNQATKLDKKFKATIYLTEEAEKAFAELYVSRYMKDRKIDRSKIACEAILALHKKENEMKEEALAQNELSTL